MVHIDYGITRGSSLGMSAIFPHASDGHVPLGPLDVNSVMVAFQIWLQCTFSFPLLSMLRTGRSSHEGCSARRSIASFESIGCIYSRVASAPLHPTSHNVAPESITLTVAAVVGAQERNYAPNRRGMWISNASGACIDGCVNNEAFETPVVRAAPTFHFALTCKRSSSPQAVLWFEDRGAQFVAGFVLLVPL